MKRILLLAVALAVLPLAARSVHADDPDLGAIYVRIADGQSWRSPFVQTKTLSRLHRSLVSRGTMVMAKDLGIIWTITEPYPSRMVVGPDYLIQRLGDGKDSVLSFADNPVFTSISSTIALVFDGNLTALDERFSLDLSMQGDGWTIVLSPKEEALASFAASFTLEGTGGVLRSLTMLERSGDATRYDFLAITKGGLTAEERDAFAF